MAEQKNVKVSEKDIYTSHKEDDGKIQEIFFSQFNSY